MRQGMIPNSPLLYLDDAPGVGYARLASAMRAWIAGREQIVTKTAPPVLTQKPAAPQSTVFTSRPTLKQMMHEYNRPVATHAAIKGEAAQDFSSDRISSIRVPQIEGKILRPATPGRTTKR